jgi:hypothetical protein
MATFLGAVRNVNDELKRIYKAVDCTDRNDCEYALEQVKRIEREFGSTPSTRARMRSLINKLKQIK